MRKIYGVYLCSNEVILRGVQAETLASDRDVCVLADVRHARARSKMSLRADRRVGDATIAVIVVAVAEFVVANVCAAC